MVKSWLVQDQTVLGKDYSNLLIADSLLKTIWFINAPCYGNEALASPKANELTIPEQTATGKGTSNSFMAGCRDLFSLGLTKILLLDRKAKYEKHVSGNVETSGRENERVTVRAFATIINKCLSGKETGMDKIRLSRAQILSGMFHKKNIDYVYLLWEDLLFQIENKDAKKTNKMSYTRFTKIIIDYFMSKDQSILRRNKMFWHIARDDTMFTSMRCISRHEDTQVYGTILPKELTYHVIKPVQATKGTRLKSKAKVAKPDKKKQPVKKPKAKGLAVLSKQQNSSGTDEGTGTRLGVLDVPIYKSESKKESWGDSESKDEDNENDYDDLSDEGVDNNDGNDGDDDDANDDDKQKGDDTNNDDEETDSDRTESDRIKIPILDQSTTEYYEEEEENIDDEEMMHNDEDDEVIKELYDDVNVNLGNEDTEMTNADHADNEIASLMETSARHTMTVLENTSGFTTTTPPPPPFFNSLLQQATPTPKPTTSEATTSFPSLSDFSFVFRFNDRVTNMEKDLSEINQVDQYDQALSSIPAIVDRYMDNKLGEAINKAILAHNKSSG
ncbi:hypothetical protein Tco_0933276 [Tanacetum coccineum]